MGRGESTGHFPLSITLFDLDKGAGNCINVTVERTFPLVISNLINSEQRGMFPDFALESGTRMRKFYDYLWSVWSGEVLLNLSIASLDLSIASPGSSLPFIASWNHSHCPTPRLRASVKSLMISVCKQQNSWRTCFVFSSLIFFSHDRNNSCLLQKSKPERIRACEMCDSPLPNPML